MTVYEKIADKYINTNTNLFAITGNINDIVICEDNKKKKIKQLKTTLQNSLEKVNHLIYFSPSNGIKFTNNSHLEEFYSYDLLLKNIHEQAFSKDYAHTKYDILSGLHMIKVLLSSYRDLREKNPDKDIKNLVILIDDSDIVFPNKPIEHMSNQEKLILSLAREILGAQDFIDSPDSVILLSNNFFSIDEGIRSINRLYPIKVPLPDKDSRYEFIKHKIDLNSKKLTKKEITKIAQNSAGLTLSSLDTILNQNSKNIILNIKEEVSRSIKKSIGKHISIIDPEYGFDKVIGYDKLKQKAKILIGRMDSKHTWRALAYIGATGTGKDFQTEAFLYEANIPVIKLENIKSKWYGQTAVVLEKIKMVARSFDKVIIYKPEADKLFADPESKDTHQTDQEMTGIFLDWMSDSKDKGKIFWVFNTSRPQMFPVDFQRRIEIKLPIFDLSRDERGAFIERMFEINSIKLDFKKDSNLLKKLLDFTENLSSDNIRMMTQEVASTLEKYPNVDILDIIEDLNFDIVKDERQRQAREAARFSTYKSLIANEYKDSNEE
jgi:SpoVK/Ycf46/Vps4 family AAA+-type ATPase